MQVQLNVDENLNINLMLRPEACPFSPVLDLMKEMTEIERCQIKISVYVLNEFSFLQRVMLEEMTKLEDIALFRKMAQEKRLVATVEKGDKVHAFASERMSKEIKDKALHIDGKNVVVHTLNDQQYADIIKISEFVIALLETNQLARLEKKSNLVMHTIRRLPSPQEREVSRFEMFDLFRKLVGQLQKTVQRLLEKEAESQREERKLDEAAAKRRQNKKELEVKDRLQKEIISEETSRQNTKREVLHQDTDRQEVFVELSIKS